MQIQTLAPNKVAALLLTTSLVVQGFTRSQAFAGEKTDILESRLAPCLVNASNLPAPEHQTFRIFKNWKELNEACYDAHLGFVFYGVHLEAVEHLDEIIAADKDPTRGISKEQKDKFVMQFANTALLLQTAFSDFATRFPGKEDFSTKPLVLLVTIANYVSESTPESRKQVTDAVGTHSDLGQNLVKLRSILQEELTNRIAQHPDGLHVLNGKQPYTVFLLPWREVVAASREGLISSSSEDFVAARLSDEGPDFALLGMRSMNRLTTADWKNQFVLLGGGKRIGESFKKVVAPLQIIEQYLKLDDNNLIRIQQYGCELSFFKNSSGYAQSTVGAEIAGTGGVIDTPLANLYAPISNFEALAYLDYDWKRIISEGKKRRVDGKEVVDENLLLRSLQPIAPESSPRVSNLPIEVTMTGERIPVYVKLSDSTLLRISQIGDHIKFARTESGYAVAGGSAHIAGTGVSADLPISHLYTEISAEEALAYFKNDFRPIFEVVSMRNCADPQSVSPSLLLEVVAPKSRLLKK